MERKDLKFWKRLEEADGVENYELREQSKGPHSERFIELMSKEPGDFPNFTDEEIEFLGKEDLGTLDALFPDEAAIYMQW